MKSDGALSGDSVSGDSLSGDSFYVRVNMSLPGGSCGALPVSCNDILHVTNTRPAGTSSIWLASHVHPCQLLDLQGGTLPNYYRWGMPRGTGGGGGRSTLSTRQGNPLSVTVH